VKVKIKSVIPAEGYHLVKDGETLYSISKKYGLSVDDLVKLNNMEGYILRRNMILKVK
jgi:LysM repeat protein